MADAQGIYKTLAYKKQSAKGTAESGSGGQLLRRETATFNTQKATYSANEITSHQQHTGDKHGIKTINGSLSGVLSAGTYTNLIGSILRKDPVATSAISSLSLTIAGAGPYTVTRATGDFLTGGIKVGDVVRLTGAGLAAPNVGKNLLVTGVTATVLTVLVVNESALTTEGPIASCTVTVTGKKAWAANASHTNDYYTVEEWFDDIERSHLYSDVQFGQADIGLPGTGNATIGLSAVGISDGITGAQVLTTPAAETTSEVLAAANGMILVNGTRQIAVTGLNISINGNVAAGEAVIGSNTISDLVKGSVMVSGSFTAIFQSDTLAGFFDAETAHSIIAVVTENDDADADFITFVLPRCKIMSADKDDGKKQIVRTYNFTAEYNGSGGTALANHATICSIQDSNI
jgi:hypothetical protein